jgi:phosphoribosylamine---glycine ligase
MKILVIGGGGREHALAWKLAQSPKVQKVYLAPGNGGTALDPRFENINLSVAQELRAWAATENIALTVVGPEAPLAAGVVNEFRQHGLRIFGPTQAAAQLESSKAFSKAFMQRHGIPLPTPRLHMPMWIKKAHRLWSRPTAWPQARAW